MYQCIYYILLWRHYIRSLYLCVSAFTNNNSTAVQHILPHLISHLSIYFTHLLNLCGVFVGAILSKNNVVVSVKLHLSGTSVGAREEVSSSHFSSLQSCWELKEGSQGESCTTIDPSHRPAGGQLCVSWRWTSTAQWSQDTHALITNTDIVVLLISDSNLIASSAA